MASARTAVDRLEARLDRLDRVAQVGEHTVEIATEYARLALAKGSGSPDSILVRRDFLARKRPMRIKGERDRTARRKPALAQLVERRGNTLLQVQLMSLFLAQVEPARLPLLSRGVERRLEGSQTGLVDFIAAGNASRETSATKRDGVELRNDQLARVLVTLTAPELQLMNAIGFDGRSLSSVKDLRLHVERAADEFGQPFPYKRPALGSEAVVSIPLGFFTNGWVQVLTKAEIAFWLMLRDIGDMRTATDTTASDVFATAGTRLDFYDLTRDTWESHRMLERVGLIRVTRGEVTSKTVKGEGQRFESAPHSFDVDDSGLAKLAVPEVRAAVAGALEEARYRQRASRASAAPKA